MDDLEREHYAWLKKSYDYLVKIIMGSNYYTNSIHVFDADVEAFTDMKNKLDSIKHNLKLWRIIAVIMMIVSCCLIIFR